MVSAIEEGLVCYLGIAVGDTPKDLEWLAKKVAGLRIFPDSDGKMNLSAASLSLSIMVVPQFTLFGDIRNGYRPSFSGAEAPSVAADIYEQFMKELAKLSVSKVCGGVFGADMTIEQVNRGPVTIILDSKI